MYALEQSAGDGERRRPAPPGARKAWYQISSEAQVQILSESFFFSPRACTTKSAHRHAHRQQCDQSAPPTTSVRHTNTTIHNAHKRRSVRRTDSTDRSLAHPPLPCPPRSVLTCYTRLARCYATDAGTPTTAHTTTTAAHLRAHSARARHSKASRSLILVSLAHVRLRTSHAAFNFESCKLATVCI